MGRRGLGRGLAALMGDAAGLPPAAVREVQVDDVRPNPFQPRSHFAPEALAELEESIREHGVLQPILMRELPAGGFQIIAGERRFRAAIQAGLRIVPASVRTCSDREMLEIALVENVQREEIGAVEAARAFERMAREFGMTQESIAQRVGKSRVAIANTLRLLRLPEDILKSLEQGEITEGHARAILVAETPERMAEVWRTAVRRSLSVRETERLAREEKLATGGAPAHAAVTQAASAPVSLDPNEQKLLDDLQALLRTRVALRRDGSGGGKLEVFFYGPEDLERVLDLLLEGSR